MANQQQTPASRGNGNLSEDQALLERFRVREAIARYVDALNHRDWVEYRDCWTEDATFQTIYETEDSAPSKLKTRSDITMNLAVRGIEEVMQLVSGYNKIPWLVQLPHAAVVELDGERRARSRHVMIIYSHAEILVGHCYDEFYRCDDGVWRFRSRDYRPTYFESLSPPGLVTRTLPDEDYRDLPHRP